ncbi:hypothetical protein COLO4_16309 [Corchorus olitorius]|uniref:Uncharacterized protein n=1 Tax=Corchorus olitorius TaxID=93759 RepID=A0A1R3JIB2_9ROSI|nr:hypothetical protein COLO4_16309 [Corchorus olitorius]
MEEDAVGDPPSKGERSGVKRGRSSLEQDAMGEDFPPLTGVPNPNKTANRQTYEKGKPAVPTASHAGSCFAVLDNMDDSQDSDEVVPNTVETNVPIAADKSGNDMRIRGDSRKQLQQNLHHVAQLANKGGVGGSSSDNAKSKHGPKVVVSDSANMSPAVNIPNKAFAPKHATVNPVQKQNLEPSVIDEMSTPSIVEPTQSQPNPCINLDQDDDMVGIGINGAAREKDTSSEEDFMNV